jgi:hypothetical protein
MLGIPWATQTEARTQGTFKEVWVLDWRPEVIIALIDKGVWGNTVEEAARQYHLYQAQKSTSTGALARMILEVLPAELFDALPVLLRRINDVAALSTEVMDLMSAVAALSKTGRYGNVRQTDRTAIQALLEGFIARICVALPNTCVVLDEDAVQQMFAQLRQMHHAVRLLKNDVLEDLWTNTLRRLSEISGVHPLAAGCATRLLFDHQQLNRTEAATRFSFALSPGQEPSHAAAWLEGFLKGSGMILLYDDTLWNLLYEWVDQLPETAFNDMLPVLRRTFAKFEPAERRKLGEKAQKGIANLSFTHTEDTVSGAFDPMLADIPMKSLIALMQ